MTPECSQCIQISDFEQKLASELFAKTKEGHWYIGLNPKVSPFPGRVYALLRRHLTENDIFGALNKEELYEFTDLNKRISRAIKDNIDGVKTVRCFVRDGWTSHIDFDFMPVTNENPYGNDNYGRKIYLVSHSKSENIPSDKQVKLKKVFAEYFIY